MAQFLAAVACISGFMSVFGDVLKNLAYRKPAVSIFLWIMALTISVCLGAQTVKK